MQASLSAKQMAVYIISNKPNGTLYTGITSALIQRIYQHKTKHFGGYSARYNLDKLMYFELIDEPLTAIAREKEIKSWRRAWRVALIEKDNPEWRDLYPDLLG